MKVKVMRNHERQTFEIDIPDEEFEGKTLDEVEELINNHVLKHIDQNMSASWEIKNERFKGVGEVKK